MARHPPPETSVLIPEHKIQEVLERVDLVALVSRHVELKKSGRSYKGRCPFHDEKSASFYVTPEMRRYKCFGCQVGGDAIAFVQRYLGKSFTDAVQELAREVGVDLEAAVDPTALERKQLREVTDAAQTYVQRLLWDEVRGRAARAYLHQRGVTEETAKAFGLGLSSSGWSDLAEHLAKLGMIDWALKAGLVQPRTRGEGHYDMFRGRLIVPIRSVEGRTLAFGGRLLEGCGPEGSTGPKYLNSRESKLYNKSEVLYGMDLSREALRKCKAAVLVEGYFDCIGLHQAGIKNAVALCSTALTPGHLALLKRADAQELILLLDGDEAGRKAVERLAGSILASGTSAQVALLPEGEDPDTFAQREGEEGLDRLLKSARPLSEHLLSTLLPEGKEAAFEAKMRALDRLRPVVAQLPVGLLRSAFFSTLSRHFSLPAAELEAALRGKVPPPPQPVPKLGSAQQLGEAPVRAPLAVQAAQSAIDPLEALFVALVLARPTLRSVDPFGIQDELRSPALRAVLEAVTSSQGAQEVLADASETVTKALEAAVRHLPKDPAPDEAWAGDFRLVCRRLKLRRIDEGLSHIAKTALRLGQSSDHALDEETRRLQEERIALLALRKMVIDDAVSSRVGTNRVNPGV